jgi:inosose dehydratase
MSLRVPVGNGPVSWGIDFADQPGIPAWDTVFAQIARAGYTWAELGPIGYLPADVDLVRARFEEWGLSVAGSFIFEPLHDPGARARVRESTERTCAAISALGGRYLVIIDEVSEDRATSAGRSISAATLDRAGQTALLETIGDVLRISRDHGLMPVLHPHAGTYVEFDDEIDLVLDAFDPSELGLCIDTGHAAYAGVDPIELARRHAARVHYVHLKDLNGSVHAAAMREEAPFFEALERGVFCPLGQGRVDFAGLVATLGRIGYSGPATVEQDRRPDTPGDPLTAAIESLRYLTSIGVEVTP